MNIKKLLAGIGILGAVCGLVTGAKEWKEATTEEETTDENGEPVDVVFMEAKENEEKEETTED